MRGRTPHLEANDSAKTEGGGIAAANRTFAFTLALGVAGLIALGAAWAMNGKGIEWKIGPESIIALHKASTHFPIGLLLTSTVFEAFALLLRRDDLRIAAFWTLLTGTAGAVGAAILGFLGNPFAGDASEMGQKVLLHQRVGLITAVLFVALSVWRVARRGRASKSEGAVWVLATLIGIALVSVTGYMGGHIME